MEFKFNRISRQDVEKVSTSEAILHLKLGQPEKRKKTSKIRKEIEKFATVSLVSCMA
jgi:hypothetical protein